MSDHLAAEPDPSELPPVAEVNPRLAARLAGLTTKEAEDG